MSIVNWDVFNSNFDDCRHEFECFAYQLFCYEFGQKYGIFRFYNQPYIETEPIRFENDYIGFQAKYYEAGTHLSDRKSELTEAINKSSKKYPGINRFIIYTNKEFGASTDKNNSQPKYKAEIEAFGQKVGITVEWRMQSHFEKMSFEKELSTVFDYFFTLNNGIRDFIKKIEEHKTSLYNNINSNIIHNGLTYKLNRPTINIDEFLECDSFTMLVFGEGGCGKSAVVKDALISREDLILCAFMATDFNVSSMVDVSFRFGTRSMEEFCAAFAEHNKKICVIESAENIINAKNTSTFAEFYNLLIKNKWKVIFTIRTAYIEHFINHIIFNSNNIFFEVKKLSQEELKDFGDNNGITLPQNKTVLDYISNLFYLSMYIKTVATENSNSINDFLDRIWDNVICKKGCDNALSADIRGNTATSIALSIIDNGILYSSGIIENIEVVKSLAEDGIIYYDNKFEGYRFSHDVYQEIIVKHYFSKSFKLSASTKEFFEKIGDNFIIRKIFRSWLNDETISSYSETSAWIADVMLNESILQIWKDEILTILLSSTDNSMSSLIEQYLCNDNFSHLDRTAVLLNTSCRIVNTSFLSQDEINTEKYFSNIYRFTVPYGEGWSNFISFVWKHRETISWSELLVIHITKVLQAWTQANKEGTTTKTAGLLALFLCEKAHNYENHIHLDSNAKELFYQVISLSGYEIFEEVDNRFERWNSERTEDYYFEDLMKYILSDIVTCAFFCQKVPKLVIKWARIMWMMPPQKEFDSFYHSDNMSIEYSFGINPAYSHDNRYSAFFTPIYYLLRIDPADALSFIIDFINETTENFYNSDINQQYFEASLVPVFITESTTVQQYCHEILWNAYRGFGNAPSLYCNILMALEKWLYETIELLCQEKAVTLCKNIIMRAKTVALTSVVESMVLAYYNKLFPICCILMRTKQIFELDINRLFNENLKINFINFGVDKLSKEERQKSNDLPYRKKRLEDVVWQYQMFRSEGESQECAAERSKAIQNIIDMTFGDYNKLEYTEQILLCRMDRRHQKLNVSEVENGIRIETEPDLSEDLKEYQHNIQQQSEQMNKEACLNLWLYAHIDGNVEEYKKYPQYEENPLIALEEIENASSSSSSRLFNKYSLVSFACVLVCDFSNTVDRKTLSSCSNAIQMFLYSALVQRKIVADVHTAKALINSLPYIFDSYSAWEKVSLRNPIILTLGIMLERLSLKEVLNILKTKIYNTHKGIHMLLIKLYIFLAPHYRKEVSKRHGISIQQFYRGHRKDICSILKGDGKECSIDLLPEDEKIVLLMALPYECHINYSEIASAEIDLCKVLFSSDRRCETRKRNVELEFAYIENLAQNIYENPMCCHTSNIIKCLDIIDNTKHFLINILGVYQMDKIDDFWYIWNTSFDHIVNIYSSHRGLKIDANFYEEKPYFDCLDSILVTFMFSSNLINTNYLLGDNSVGHLKVFFSKCIHKIGAHPGTIFSLAKFAHDTNYENIEIALTWIYNVIDSFHVLSHSQLLTNTVFYLEEFIQRYISQNRIEIKDDPQKRNRVTVVLNFLVNKGSTVAYLLRDSIC